jgi:hypothetical protein
VSRLVLVLGDLHGVSLRGAAQAALPRLPQLERWLARARRESAAGGWRPWLRSHLRNPALRSLPLASIAAAPLSATVGTRPVWLATPVHWVAGLDTVRLHPDGLVRLTWEEQQALERDFAAVFEGSGWALRATGRRELVLVGGTPQADDAVRSHDPAFWLGADPRSALPSGPGSNPLRRLGAEMEMWLHEHPVNLHRLSRGQLSASALWIWGGGAPAVSAPDRAVPKSAAALAWADELFVDGLGRLGAYQVAPLPDRWPLSGSSGGGAGAEPLVACELGAAPGAAALQALEDNWIAPSLEHWRNGGVRRATLVVGEHAMTLDRSPFAALRGRFARTHPWWETLSSC